MFDLFCDLEASDAQTDFPTLYAVGRDGLAKRELADQGKDLVPLFETILDKIPPAPGDPDAPLQIIICNLSHDEYVGRLAVGRIVQGTIKKAQNVVVVGEKATRPAAIKVLFTFEGLKRIPCESASAGENIAIAGIDEIDIGDTIATIEHPVALPRIHVEEPTIKMKIGVNTSPFAGQCKASKFLTSRQLRERLELEAKKNLAIKLEMTDSPDTFTVYGRGELGLAILVETMRREGYEMVLSNPEVVTREVDGKLMEPVELVVLDIPDSFIGVVTERLGRRRGRMIKMHNPGFGRARLEFRVPSRGLIGFRGEFLTSTRGTGLLNALFDGWEEWGTMTKRANGAIVADRSGEATPYALFHLQPRGVVLHQPGRESLRGHDHRRAQPPERHRRQRRQGEEAVQRSQPRQRRERGARRPAHPHHRDGDGVDRRRRAGRSYARRRPRAKAHRGLQPEAPPAGSHRGRRAGWGWWPRRGQARAWGWVFGVVVLAAFFGGPRRRGARPSFPPPRGARRG